MFPGLARRRTQRSEDHGECVGGTRPKMLLFYVLSVLIFSAASSTASPLTDCTTKESNESMLNVSEPFQNWHTIAIASNSAEKFDGLNSMTISKNNRSILFLQIDRDGICTKIEINYSGSSGSASKDNSGYKTLASNTEYVVLHHYNRGKCITDNIFLLGRNRTVSSAIMDHFNRLVECAEIPGLTMYILPQENGNCEPNMSKRKKREIDLSKVVLEQIVHS